MEEKKTALREFIGFISTCIAPDESTLQTFAAMSKLAEALDKDLSAMREMLEGLEMDNLRTCIARKGERNKKVFDLAMSRAEREQIKILKNVE